MGQLSVWPWIVFILEERKTGLFLEDCGAACRNVPWWGLWDDLVNNALFKKDAVAPVAHVAAITGIACRVRGLRWHLQLVHVWLLLVGSAWRLLDWLLLAVKGCCKTSVYIHPCFKALLVWGRSGSLGNTLQLSPCFSCSESWWWNRALLWVSDLGSFGNSAVCSAITCEHLSHVSCAEYWS